MTAHKAQVARQNWATNIQFQADAFVMPETIEQLQVAVHRATQVKVVGAGHSFNQIADTTGTLVSLARLPKQLDIDPVNQTATISGGMTYNEIAPALHEAGFGLPNLSSTPHVTVIGACMTATHGSGNGNKVLADCVSAVEIVTADGELVRLSRAANGEKFPGMVVSLGALGVVARLTLDLVPTYFMQHEYYRQLPLDQLLTYFDAMAGSGYSVSLGSRWQSDVAELVLVRRHLPNGHALPVPADFFGAAPATTDLFDGYQQGVITYAGNGIPGPWYERLPFFNVRSTIRGENERQSEYFVHRDHTVDALAAVRAIGPRMANIIKVCEIRTIAADDIWLSPAYEQDSLAIHFSWVGKDVEIMELLPTLEQALAPFAPRPHWGKMFTMAPEVLQAGFPKMDDFRALVEAFDPAGNFRNQFIEKYVMGE